ncbi:Type 1 glutamine amidotransferase-like domain-containing protein [Leuconostoc fallax]|uniref:Type 1 glutamine amidotransferase-like domain-containing protein n=1 Tax=Leuconostoc fallax TaxID=1251 RepID=UPI0020905193|nr:Type 1 glutamine amidotransferase-like domain-containing protein [Leuconostoc fallax]MCO6183494.1 Type 1 glutamine amidotransferase-like domain-containing protein [Leuconostoc fallax]
MKNILLTSYFAGTIRQFKRFMANQSTEITNILFIDTASKVEEYTGYIDEAYKALLNLNYTIDTLDISNSDKIKSKNQIQNADTIFIAGGNTFYLLDKLKSQKLDKLLIDKINTGTPYIGESAGAIILSPDITYIQELDDASFAPNLNTYTGLGITDFSILPHYLDKPFENEASTIFNKYHDKLDLITLNNQETISILNDRLILN